MNTNEGTETFIQDSDREKMVREVSQAVRCSPNLSYTNTSIIIRCNKQEMKALFPGTPNKLHNWVSEWLTEYVIFLHGLAQQWKPWKKRNLAQR